MNKRYKENEDRSNRNLQLLRELGVARGIRNGPRGDVRDNRSDRRPSQVKRRTWIAHSIRRCL